MCLTYLKLYNEIIHKIIDDKCKVASKHKISMKMNSKNMLKVKAEPIILSLYKITVQSIIFNEENIDNCKIHI